jgi:hypothetical protein
MSRSSVQGVNAFEGVIFQEIVSYQPMTECSNRSVIGKLATGIALQVGEEPIYAFMG